jgi:N-acyl-D-aspartate/D-glutamate deacylase
MDYDLKIEGGTIVDGTGAPRFLGDVAVKDGLIVAVGECPGEARETLDARGAIVSPGFVDIHTHYDGQVTWDSDLAPSSLHGVTTIVMGSCGVGFAPVRPSDRERLIRLMEGVEDIPGSALSEGIEWAWESFPEYIAALDNRPHSIDICTQVPHDALRVYVMGDRASADEAATSEDVAAMRLLLGEALDAGAFGFSTGRSDNHRTADGLATPASEAHESELVGLAQVFAGRDRGVYQVVSDFDVLHGDEQFEREFSLVERVAEATGGRPLSMSLMQRDQSPDQWRWVLERVEALRDRGLPVHIQAAPRGIGVLLGLEATFQPFMGFPSYKAIHDLPLAERVARMRAPGFKERLLSESSEPVAGDGSPMPPLADLLLQSVDQVAWRIFQLGEDPNYEPAMSESLGARAAASGRAPLDVLLDALLEDEGNALLYFPVYNYTEGSLENVRTMMNHPSALPGLSDGGAHVGTICDASFSTFILTHWARDRAEGRLSLEDAVERQTSRTARFIGLEDRGSIAVGKRADLNVIDFDALRLERPLLVGDLPAGGARLLQRARGYRATLVKGEVILRDDELTGAMPGKVVRAGS